MSLILSLETSTTVCSVALSEQDQLLAMKTITREKSHASHLAPMIQDVLKESGVKASDLKAVAVSEGPGSYTGLRIGVSTAKGLCYALDIPLIAINSLKALAQQVEPEGSLRCPMIDARRMEVYTLLMSSNDQVELETTPMVIDEESFQDQLSSSEILFFGDGAAKCSKVIKHQNAIFLEDVIPQANGISKLAYDKWKKEEFEDVAYFEPFYLKEFRATKPKPKV